MGSAGTGIYLGQIVVGSDDSAWFTDNVQRGNVNFGNLIQFAQVDRIDRSGVITPFRVGGVLVRRRPRTRGISFSREGHVGRIGSDGQVREFRVRNGSGFQSLAFGAGGYLWLTKETEGHDAIQRISRDDTVKAFPLPQGYSGLAYITRGTDGAMWFTEYSGNRIGRITSTGKITEYPLGVRAPGEAQPVPPVGEIAAGAHRYLWFGTFSGIGRLSPSSGKVTRFDRGEGPERLAAGPDGSIWFAEYNKIGRITPNGRFTKMMRLPREVETVRGLAVGADGSVWFTAEGREGGVVGRITFGG